MIIDKGDQNHNEQSHRTQMMMNGQLSTRKSKNVKVMPHIVEHHRRGQIPRTDIQTC